MRLPPRGTGVVSDHLPACQVWAAPFSSTAVQRESVGQEMPYTEISSEAEVGWIMVARVDDVAAGEGEGAVSCRNAPTLR